MNSSRSSPHKALLALLKLYSLKLTVANVPWFAAAYAIGLGAVHKVRHAPVGRVCERVFTFAKGGGVFGACMTSHIF